MLFVRHPDAIWTDLNGKTVVLGIGSSRYFEIEGVGRNVWLLLEQPRSVSELAAAIVADYKVDPAQCQRDVQGFLDALVAAQLADHVT